MLITTDINRRPIFKYMIWIILYIFFINFLSYPIFAYPVPIDSKVQHKISVGEIINSVLNLFASDAHAEEEEGEAPLIHDNLGLTMNSIQEFTGSYSQSYAIEAPPGRGGMAPQIALVYSSGRQNGWIGVGWDIPVASIERDTKDGEPGYDDNDQFIINLNGASSKLVKDGSEYRLKDEGAFLKIEKIGDYWEVKDKNGTNYRFGYNSNSKLDGGFGTFRWYLDSTKDLNGNEITYLYYIDTTNNQVYLSQIDYDVDNSIEFVLDLEARTDITPMYNTYFRVETVERLKEIHVKNGSNIVRAYSLEYDYSGTSSRTILKSIKVYGNDAVIGASGIVESGSSLPENTFNIPAANNSFADYVNWHDYIQIKDFNLAAYISKGDFNGDGKMDMLFISPEPKKYMVMLSNGSGFEDPQPWHDYNEDLDSLHSNFWVSDFNGDENDDLMYYDSDTDKFMVMLSNGTGFEDYANWLEHEVSGSLSGYTSWIYDFNRDGKNDIMYKSSVPYPQYYVMLSNGAGFSAPESWHSYENAYNISKTLRLGDFNGDGLIDITYVSLRYIVTGPLPDKYVVMLNNGSGFEDPDEWHEYISAKSDYSLNYLQACDFNGDGLTDLLYTSTSDEYMVMLSNGSGFEDPVYWNDAVTTSDDNPYLMFNDLNGDNKTDIMYLSPSPEKYMVMLSSGSEFLAPQPWHDYDPAKLLPVDPLGILWSPLLFLEDFDGNGIAEICYLSSDITEYRVMKNASTFDHIIKETSSLGAVTEVEYVSSSEWENEYLPFKLQTVKSITTKDKDQSPSHTSTKTFTYQGGKYDTVEREFRGFEGVTVTDDATGFVTETHYLTDEIYKGKVSWTETKDSLGYKVVRTDNSWNIKDYGDDRRFIYLDDSVVTKYDENGASLATITKDYGYSDDSDYSNLVTEYMHTSDGINKFTRTNYYNDEANWIIGKPENIRISTSDPGSTGTQALRETKFTYYTNGLLHEKKLVHWENGAPIEYTTTYGYDIYGNKTSEADAKGTPPTTFNYNESMGMFPNLVTNALDHIIHRTFDPSFGTILTEADPNNQTVNYTYDEFGRKESATYPDGSTETFTYNIASGNHYMTVQSTDNPMVTIKYDNFGRSVKKTVSDGINLPIMKDKHYDNAGRISSESRPYFSGEPSNLMLYQYDSQRGYLNHQYNCDGTDIAITRNGFSETVTDENGHSRTITKDSLGRPKKIVEPTGGITDYEYDIFDNLTYVKDQMGNITNIGYDDLGQKVSIDDPYMGHWEYDYDKNGNLIWQQDAELNEIHIEHDELDRVDSKAYNYDKIKIEYTYDETTQGYHNKGTLTTLETIDISDPNNEIVTSVIEYNYDKMGYQVNETRTIDGTVYQIDKKYDNAGRLEYIIYPDTARTRYDYAYNGMGYLSEVRKHGAAYPYIDIQDYDYNALGQIRNAQYGNGTETTYQYYGEIFRLENLITTDINGSDIQHIHYTYDNVGNITSMQVNTLTDALYTVNHSFVYDEVDRLTSATATCSNDSDRTYNQGYTYDFAGNMTSKTGVGGWEVIAWEDPVKHIRPASVNFNYEVAGVAQRNIIYNQDQKPAQITYKGGTTYLTYDGAGERIKKAKGAETVIYVGGIYEIKNGQAMSHIFANGQKIVTLTNGKEYYTHSDHLGSTSVVTDENGNIVEEIGYLPFGTTLFRNVFSGSTWESAYRFTGQEFDEEYHLYNYNARLYDPVMARFISPDTIVSEPFNPQDLNRYSYCFNNPLRYIDPSGYEEDELDEYELDEIVVNGSPFYLPAYISFGSLGYYNYRDYSKEPESCSGVLANPITITLLVIAAIILAKIVHDKNQHDRNVYTKDKKSKNEINRKAQEGLGVDQAGGGTSLTPGDPDEDPKGIGKIKSLRGKSLRWIKRNKPKGWKTVKAEGNGWKWIDENGIERMRFMRPSGKNAVNSQWGRQSNGYFRWTNPKGQYLDIDGNVVPKSHPHFQELTHIPYGGL